MRRQSVRIACDLVAAQFTRHVFELCVGHVPGHGDGLPAVVGHDSVHGLRKLYPAVDIGKQRNVFERVRLHFDLIAVAYEVEYTQRFERFAIRVEQRLVIHCAAAEVSSGVVWIVA